MQSSKFQQTAAHYFQRFGHFNQRYNSLPAPNKNLRQLIVIPAFAENLTDTLQSLGRNAVAHAAASEVLVVLNNSAEDAEAVKLHRQQAGELHGQVLENGVKMHAVLADDLAPKQAGVGLARKIGMDIALQRFAEIDHDGFIVCLDADCTVSNNYLEQLLQYEKDEAINGMSLCFEHNYQRLSEPERQRIIDYEIWLRYYIEALRFADCPHAYHTVGSSMLCRASAYAKIGGMNRKKAGEDFYFLHKLIPQGKFKAAAQPVVYPSARISTRVPFGTGRAMLEQESGRKDFSKLYHPAIFEELKQIHGQLNEIYEGHYSVWFNSFLAAYPKFQNSLTALRLRSKSVVSFAGNFFYWWDGFKVLQYVHFRQKTWGELPSAQACCRLLGINEQGGKLLEKLRALEK